jgi:hypothetical protein
MTGFPSFLSVLRQILGCVSKKGAWLASTSYGDRQSTPNPQRHSAKAMKSVWVQLPDIHTEKVLSWRTDCLTGHVPARSSSLWYQDLQPRKKPLRVIVSPVTVAKASSFSSSDAFRAQEWFNLTRRDVLRWRRITLLGSFLVGWLVGLSVHGLGLAPSVKPNTVGSFTRGR